MDNKNNIQNSIKKAVINATLFGISATSVGCSDDVSSLNTTNNNESIESTIDSSVKEIRTSNKKNSIVNKETAKAIKAVGLVEAKTDNEIKTSDYQYYDLSDVDLEKELDEDNALNSEYTFDENVYDSIDLSDYKGVSIVNGLALKNYNFSKEFRIAAADYYEIENYCVNGYISAEKNLELLKIFQLPVDQRPRKQKEIVSKNETTIEEGMYDFETIEIYEPIDELTHKKIVKLVCIQTGEEKLIEEKVEKCEFENFYNKILKLNQKLCKGCHQFVHSSKIDHQNNSNSANNNPSSEQNSHKNDGEEKKEECVHTFKRTIRYRSAKNGNHFKIDTLVCKKCDEKITHTYYESCEFNKWNYDTSKDLDYRECKHCGYQETRKHEHQIVDGTDSFIWKNGKKAHDKVHLGTCTVCQKEVVQVLEENIACTTEYQYKVIDGIGMDVPVCKDCKHEYRNLAEEHTRHELIGEVHYEYEHDEKTDRHRKVKATRKCEHCGKEVEIELTDEEKEWKACSYGEEKTDTEGNKYQECSVCGYKKYVKEECKHGELENITQKVIWNKDTKTHNIIEEGICKDCGEKVTKTIKENIACTTEYQYKVIDGIGMDVPVCKDCKHEYRNLAEEHTRHELIGEVHYEYEHDEKTDRHRKVKATRKCEHCGKEVEIELTDEEKEWKACSYGEEKTDTEGNKYQECSVCGYKKYVKEECKHGELENITQKVIWNKDTKTHNIIEEGICKDCGEKVTVVLEKDVDCNSEWHYNVDGRDIFECSDCHHVYENIAHNHNPKVETIDVKTKTDDGWCVKTTADCITCGDNYIVSDQSSQDHNFEFIGTEPYYNPETGDFEERSKWICGDCSTVEYKPVDSVLENSSNIEDEENSSEIESETEENSSEIESETEENSPAIESETEENSPAIESETEENSPEVESEIENSSEVESETEEDLSEVESESEEDLTKTQKSTNESKNKDNQVAYLQELWHALTNKRKASLNDEVYIACLDSKGPVRTRTFKK